jgi:hypothetical protein
MASTLKLLLVIFLSFCAGLITARRVGLCRSPSISSYPMTDGGSAASLPDIFSGHKPLLTLQKPDAGSESLNYSCVIVTTLAACGIVARP